MAKDSEKWAEKARAGSKKAFEKLVKRYTPFIFRFLYDLTGSYEDARDLTQDTFLKAYTRLHTFRGDAKFSTWLYKIAYHLGIDYKRSSKRRSSTAMDERTIPAQSNMPAVDTDEREAMEKGLKDLTHSQRTAVVLHYYHQFRMREIGEILGCSESTVRVHLHRALHNLRKALKDFDPGVN
jgi:RNA polymerase sigma-70 factor (ECF subfamily)